MNRSKFLATLFGWLFLGKAVAKADVPKIISGTLEVEHGGGKQLSFMDKDIDYRKYPLVPLECKMPSGNRYPDWTVAKLRDELFIGQSQIDNLKEYTEEDFKSIINIQAYVNQNPSSGWIIWPEGYTTRLHPHLEYIRLQSNSFSAQSQAHLNHSDKR